MDDEDEELIDQIETTRALNIHGTFFERLCKHIVHNTKGFTVIDTNKPVEFPPPGLGFPSKESELDIEARMPVDNIDRTEICITIECKKNNPLFTNWIFFSDEGRSKEIKFPLILRRSGLHETSTRKPHLSKTKTHFPEVRFADQCRETKAPYKKKTGDDKQATKTSNASITDAAYQIALGTQARFWELAKSVGNDPIRSSQILIPIICTTANLFVCDFDPIDVSTDTGEIPLNKAAFQAYPFLIFRYKLPPHLQRGFRSEFGLSRADADKQFAGMDIFIVNGRSLKDFLESLYQFGRNTVFF